ncbi:beta-lactamase/transpeptidase-like protein [Gamsiella multidivaricata]|uniref:beta-lactamase/transpeptidase-like protein n=1 Tax=Gamsiella multidivaricata TaxID=101098 RepID=UPI00222049A5|nr:beta-lactamase/transpeptidase-like protein [Gamsiella multidivaricata]KAG0364170.1 hypothetical protein BGZ54_007778 [Gamsiella multidivaricata]KAI7832729.1 beta-lactamase/transpeptidase-like protein [Gamsiella multidivaricata]
MYRYCSHLFIQQRQTHSLSRPSSIKKTLADLSDVLEKGRIQCGIPGMSVAILHKGKLIFAEGFGKRNEQEPFTSETLAPIGSLTKAFTATAIGELIAEGKMDWDTTSVNKYLPEFELKDPVLTSQLTLVDLLSHRTGLPRNVGYSWYRTTESRRDLIKRLKHVEMTSKLGSKTQYNNIMYAVAGEAAANVAGIPYEKLVETKILEPLGLTNTGFSPMEMKKRSPNHAMPFSAESLRDARKGLYVMDSLDEVYMACAPAGDMYSNALDLVRWGKIVMSSGKIDGDQVLNKEALRETLTAHTITASLRGSSDFGRVVAYGMGWALDSFKGQTYYTHDGAISGFQARLDIFPDADLVVAQLFNISVADWSHGVACYIADEVLDLPKTRDWIFDFAIKSTEMAYNEREAGLKGNLPKRIPSKQAAQDLHAYEGEYTNPILGDASVRVDVDKKTGKETLICKISAFDSKMEHYHFDAFVVRLKDALAAMAGLVTFRTGGHGKVEGLHFFNEEFKRKDNSNAGPYEAKEKQ